MNYDSFIFHNEMDLLRLRFKELWDVVDKFVVVEMPVTFSNNPKPLFLRDVHWEEFKPFHSKIHSVVMKGWPTDFDPWQREHFQRNGQSKFEFTDNDIITLSDADEIPHPSVYRAFKSEWEAAKLDTMFFRYWVDVIPSGKKWQKAAICTGKYLRENAPDRLRAEEYPNIMNPGGWHFNSMGSPEFIRHKMDSFSHWWEKDVRDMYADSDLNRTRDFASSGLKKVQIDQRWPKDIWMNPERWSKHLCDR